MMTNNEVRAILKFAVEPCLCGSTTTWHNKCYLGLTNKQMMEKVEETWRVLHVKAAAVIKREANEALKAGKPRTGNART